MKRLAVMTLLTLSIAANGAGSDLNIDQVRVTPKSPTVGDLIRLEFAAGSAGRVLLDPSPEFEIVSQRGGEVVIRSFRPGPVSIAGRLLADGRAVEFRNLTLDIRSVLAPGDPLRPAPLRPPLPLPLDRRADWWLGGMAAAAALIWAGVFIRHRPRARMKEVPPLPAREEFIESVERARREKTVDFLLILSDAVRRYFARSDPRLGRELTRTEFLDAISRTLPAAQLAIVSAILSQADWLKFSGSRSVPAGRLLIDSALELLPAQEQEAAA